MVCYSPLKGWKSLEKTENDKHTIVFNPRYGILDEHMEVPCGQCVGCRLQYSAHWAVRLCHESTLHDVSCFVTFTYAPEHLPKCGGLQLDDFQKFMKRLRKKHGSIRFYHCGEYGERTARPHYHAILFGYRPDDLKLYTRSNGIPLYTSESLEKIWGLGFVTIGEVTFESAAYVARYCMKKINGKMAQHNYTHFMPDGNHIQMGYYDRLDPETGEIYSIRPEYATMSRNPGIASGWFEKYHNDVYPHDTVIHKGRKLRPPKYYDKLMERFDPYDFQFTKEKRIDAFKKLDDCLDPDRLRVKELVKLAQLKQLKKPLE